MKQLQATELAQWLTDPGRPAPLLLDVREPWEFALCRIDGSVPVPLGSLTGQIGSIDRHRPIVCICHHGVRSLHAAMTLERDGCGEVFNLVGGIDAWSRHVDPSIPVY